MKDTTTQVTATGNITTQSTAMTIHSGAIGKLMGMFSNQYSNAALAVVREYFCNGDDARIAAGSTTPTEVWLPTDLQPTLIVRDYGVGLDKDGLVSTFATYGLSTKDDSNEQTGGFGIGSKAAFTIGSQFTVTGYKDGVMTTVLFALDEHGVGQVTVMHEGPTEAPNGVLVSVGVPNVEEMREEAMSFFLTVPKGTVLVDGVEPPHYTDSVETHPLTEEAVLLQDGHGRVRVQMGPVVYPVSRAILRSVAKRLEDTSASEIAKAVAEWSSSDTLLFTVAMGDLTIAPSREDLRDTEATINRLAAAVQGVADYVQGGIQAKIDAAGSRYAAAMILADAVANLKGFKVKKNAFSFNGMEGFKTEVEIPHPVFQLVQKSWRSKTMIVGREDTHTVDFARADKTLVVAGVPKDEVSKVSRYAKRFLEAREDVKWIMVSTEASGSHEWFEYGTLGGALTMTLDEYRAALRALRASDPRVRTEPSYSTGWCTSASRDLDDRDLLTDILSEGKDIILFNETSWVRDSWAQEVLSEKFTPVILLAQQSENAFRKRVADDGSVKVFGEGEVKKILAKAAAKRLKKAALTPNERAALGAKAWISSVVNYSRKTWVHDLKEALGDRWDEIKHPALLEILDVFEIAEAVAADVTRERVNEVETLARWADVQADSAIEFKFDVSSLAEMFPLLGPARIDRYTLQRSKTLTDEVIAYINSKA